MVAGAKSEEHEVDCNVPQGSVLGPSIFGDYTSPVDYIFKWHRVTFHFMQTTCRSMHYFLLERKL